jgi:DNA-directed RNA polymerase specialized sigma24 family protein
MRTRQNVYALLLRHARRVTRRPDEAEDLLQSVLLAAVTAGKSDFTSPANIRWMIGALRKMALFNARSAVRRKQREAFVASLETSGAETSVLPTDYSEGSGLIGELAFGNLRRALLRPVRSQNAFFASHDPDGHLFIFRAASQNGLSRQQAGSGPSIKG